MKEEVAKILLKLEAVKIRPWNPFKFTSGMISPIYIDNRYVISFPKERKQIVDYLMQLIDEKNLEFDVIAGVATAGIHWAAWLAARCNKPMIYIRGKTKGHGRQNQVEGKLEPGQKVLVIEDHISTGGSAIIAVDAIRDANCVVNDCIAITTYEFEKAKTAFSETKCNIYTLTDFTSLIEMASDDGIIDSADKDLVLKWNKDALNWAKHNNIV
ncbi:orotate phosphoribosyltransferase [archaeon]|jgi:orotate phosphoribosyltransferase|nr:orotate phosphoribosyltransferase [archaeon]MBT4351868.1 orotate phosphoribosyltransferase [archaeon]MBT4647684.1 orotate phosphoribosyltransferase [archaeon]MBT6822356.1 orotate phosphoribosyltransferase [archaeon]MBT7391504.1 orotate phosphoribosyltransferase [archaeon]